MPVQAMGVRDWVLVYCFGLALERQVPQGREWGRGPAENNPLLPDSLRSSALRTSAPPSHRLQCKRMRRQGLALRVTHRWLSWSR
jgi:hypothetical protein